MCSRLSSVAARLPPPLPRSSPPPEVGSPLPFPRLKPRPLSLGPGPGPPSTSPHPGRTTNQSWPRHDHVAPGTIPVPAPAPSKMFQWLRLRILANGTWRLQSQSLESTNLSIHVIKCYECAVRGGYTIGDTLTAHSILQEWKLTPSSQARNHQWGHWGPVPSNFWVTPHYPGSYWGPHSMWSPVTSDSWLSACQFSVQFPSLPSPPPLPRPPRAAAAWSAATPFRPASSFEDA